MDPFVCIPVGIPIESPAGLRQVPSEEGIGWRVGFANAAFRRENPLTCGRKRVI